MGWKITSLLLAREAPQCASEHAETAVEQPVLGTCRAAVASVTTVVHIATGISSEVAVHSVAGARRGGGSTGYCAEGEGEILEEGAYGRDDGVIDELGKM